MRTLPVVAEEEPGAVLEGMDLVLEALGEAPEALAPVEAHPAVLMVAGEVEPEAAAEVITTQAAKHLQYLVGVVEVAEGFSPDQAGLGVLAVLTTVVVGGLEIARAKIVLALAEAEVGAQEEGKITMAAALAVKQLH